MSRDKHEGITNPPRNPHDVTPIQIDPEIKPKSAIAYTLSQAILALGKDDLKRVRDNLKRVDALLTDYEATRKGNRDKKS